MIRRYLAELIGTFVIVFAPVFTAASAKFHGGDATLLVAAIVSGLPVAAMICAVGSISAAHFNPAVTIGFAVAKRFPWRYVPQYITFQLIGAMLAAGASFAISGGGAGAHIPANPALVIPTLLSAVIRTVLLMFVIISVATDKRVPAIVPPVAIGATVVLDVLLGGPTTGGSMNPARSFGPSLFVPGALGVWWLYVVGPILGATLGALAYEKIRSEPDQAKGAPDGI